jgi:GT2 family glycosyltransferase
MKVFVVVPNWNGIDMLPKCLKSLEEQTVTAEIIVVDNGSSDGSVELAKKEFPQVNLLENKKNLGFAGGVNRGIENAIKHGADYVALFNNDAFAEKGWLEKLLELMKENANAGIVTCKFMRDDKQHFDSTGDFYSVWGLPYPRGRNKKDLGQFDEAEEVLGASGGASLYRTKMLKEIGLFDERFFAYYEDVDISFRARLAGWKIYYEPKAIAYHSVGATSSKLGSFTRYHSIKNFLLLYTKNMPAKLYFKYFPLFLAQTLRFGVSSTLKGGLLAYLKGLAVFIYYLPVVLIERGKIQKNRKVSTSEIDEILVHARPPKIPPVSN